MSLIAFGRAGSVGVPDLYNLLFLPPILAKTASESPGLLPFAANLSLKNNTPSWFKTVSSELIVERTKTSGLFLKLWA
ncbi:hypothetical protein NWE60_03010 [Mycoplasmopsis felis]|uniref:hypothetical protein n=1 Tax=Mycoplasmopsis felis TaxID=33923 RepID=UPI0021AED378|nr:hypothetical protein [Mycoplasmopsis felis]MCU9931967.1 hypothetical protein [Mycoplasmopsis felis]MCU9937063.1 hypothetical protein [Mycoplasmopsis felis]UWV83859.1 hypothetical protein NWE58_06285 [Mycoplasmopsis felis]UWW00469.1 hypothetical protein NW064_04285 [Mycoplasmopsis felis]WAM01543.1 hypothetical protein NWE60_03010 [Mycoplasmopsis felis]